MSDSEKAAFNARSEASMLLFLKSKSWPEKVRSIARMNSAAKVARESMRVARAKPSGTSPRGL